MNVRNQVLRKLVKLHNSQNVNQYDYINVSRHSRFLSWMSFFLLKFIKFIPKFTPCSPYYFFKLLYAISPAV
ncbi:hypothetical protein EFM53_04055 [Streptococcus thermophilus]|nr:hypothetical protein [Streptococcus thermophilus]